MLFSSFKTAPRWIAVTDPICVWLLDDAFELMDELAKQSCGFQSAFCGGKGTSRKIIPLDWRRSTSSQGHIKQTDK